MSHTYRIVITFSNFFEKNYGTFLVKLIIKLFVRIFPPYAVGVVIAICDLIGDNIDGYK